MEVLIVARVESIQQGGNRSRESKCTRLNEALSHQEMVELWVNGWEMKFEKLQGGKEVVSLMGETSTDLRLLEKGNVIVCTLTQVC
jgi:hypothetical protein